MYVRTDWFPTKPLTCENLFFWLMCGAFFTMPLGTSWIVIFGIPCLILWLIMGPRFRYWHIYKTSSWCRPVFALMILPWVGLIWSADPWHLGLDYAGKIHYWLYGLAFATMAFDRYRPDLFIKAFLAGLLLNFLWAIVQMAGLFPYGTTGPTGFSRGYSTLTAYLIIGMLMASFYFKKEADTPIRWVYPMVAFMYFFHLVSLGGRTGYVAFIFLFPLMAKNFFRVLTPVRIGLISLIIVGLMFTSPVVRQRTALSIEQITYHLHADPQTAWGKKYSVHQDRFYMWRGAYDLIRNHSFIGVGTGGYQTALKQIRNPKDPDIAHPHNDFLYMAVSYGICGVLVFLWFFFELVINGWQYRHQSQGFFVLSTALVMLLTGLFNTQTLDAGTVFCLSLAAGMQQSLHKFDRKQRINV